MIAVIRDMLGSDNGYNEWRGRNGMVLLSMAADHGKRVDSLSR
jgi:hypothetical protein